MEFLLAIGCAMFAGLFLSRLTSRWNLPDVTSYLIAGLLVGPLFLGRLKVPGLGFSSFEMVEAMGLLTDTALGFIAFAIGSEFRISALRRTGRQATVIAILQALAATLLVDGAWVLSPATVCTPCVRPTLSCARSLIMPVWLARSGSISSLFRILKVLV